MSLKGNSDRSVATDPIPNEELQNQIRVTAYELYQARGGSDGQELDDWLQAEQQVLDSQKRAA